MVAPHLTDPMEVTDPGLVVLVSIPATLRHRASPRQPRAGMVPAVPLVPVKEAPLLLPASLADHRCGWELREVPRATEVPGGLTPGHNLVTMGPATTAPDPEVTRRPPGQATRAIPAPPPLATACLPPLVPAQTSPVREVREGSQQ